MKTMIKESQPHPKSKRSFGKAHQSLSSLVAENHSLKLTEEEGEWLISQMPFAISLILKWCSDVSPEDAKEIVASLNARITRRGAAKTIGVLNRRNLIYHLNREKNIWITARGRKKRQGKATHLGWCQMSGKEEQIQAGGMLGQRHEDPILTRSDYRQLDDFLQILVLESKGRLRVLVLVMRRIMDSYERPKDLFKEMTAHEKAQFHPADGRFLSKEKLEKFILEAIERTLEKLRARLRALREIIPMN